MKIPTFDGSEFDGTKLKTSQETMDKIIELVGSPPRKLSRMDESKKYNLGGVVANKEDQSLCTILNKCVSKKSFGELWCKENEKNEENHDDESDEKN